MAYISSVEWRFEVAGKPYHVATERAPNGRIAVRVNGRIVAPPQSPDRVDCSFSLGTAPFHLSGTEAELRLEPVIVVEAPPVVETPKSPSIHPLDLRAMVFIVVGAILFLVSSCAYIGTKSRVSTEEERMMERDSETKNMLAMGNAIRAAFAIEAAVGLLAITGAAMLIRRLPSSLYLLDVASWSVVGGGLLGFLLVDVFMHRQLDLLNEPATALRFLRVFHTISYVVLLVFAVASGVLTSFLDREKMTILLD